MDADARYARFSQPGARESTGDRSQARATRSASSAGSATTTHTRSSTTSTGSPDVELDDDEKAATVTGFLERASSFFADHGIVCHRG